MTTAITQRHGRRALIASLPSARRGDTVADTVTLQDSGSMARERILASDGYQDLRARMARVPSAIDALVRSATIVCPAPINCDWADDTNEDSRGTAIPTGDSARGYGPAFAATVLATIA